MDKYYYLISQLPTLFFGKEPAITIDKFLEEAGKWLTPGDLKRLNSLDLNGFESAKGDHPIVTSFKTFEMKIRRDIAHWREAKKRDQEYKPTSFPLSILKEADPLEAELKLMERRWDFLDELEREYSFDFAVVLLYYLKLQLLRRYYQFNNEKGLQKFQKLYEVEV